MRHQRDPAGWVTGVPNERRASGREAWRTWRDTFHGAWNDDDWSGLGGILSADGTIGIADGTLPRRAAFLNLLNTYKACLPDLTLELDQSRPVNGTRIRWRATGRHVGCFAGVRPSRRAVHLRGWVAAGGRDGRDVVGYWDIRNFARQTTVRFHDIRRALQESPLRAPWARAVCDVEGRPVVLVATPALPGWLSWKRVMAAMRMARPLLTHQLVANRRAWYQKPVPARYGVGSERRALECVVTSTGVAGPVHIVAHSLGAPIALEFARRHPRRVCSLTLIEPTLGGLLDEAVGAAAAPAGFVADRVALYRRSLTVDQYGEYMNTLNGGGYDLVRSPYWPMAAATRQNMTYRERLLCHRLDLAALRRLYTPVLLIQGRETHMAHRLTIQRLAHLLPNNRLTTLPGGHVPHAGISGARRLVELVTPFMNGAESRKKVEAA